MFEDSAKNHEQVFVQWVAQYRRPILGYLLSLTHDADLAEDLAQETFCRAWTNRDQYTEQGSPQAYLFRIADHLLVDYYRRKREGTIDEAVWSTLEHPVVRTPHEHLELQEDIQRLRELMQELTPIQARVLSLRYYSQLKFVEIAELIDCPLNTVLSHVHRGLMALRRKMGLEEENQESQ